MIRRQSKEPLLFPDLECCPTAGLQAHRSLPPRHLVKLVLINIVECISEVDPILRPRSVGFGFISVNLR